MYRLRLTDNGRVKYTYVKYVCGDTDLDMWHRPFRSPSTDAERLGLNDAGATNHRSHEKRYWKCQFYPYRFSFYSNCLNRYRHRTNENSFIPKKKVYTG